MSENNAKNRLSKSKTRLSVAIKNLEKAVKDRVNQNKSRDDLFSFVGNEENYNSKKIIELTSIINNLNLEINNLQDSLSEIGKETEFLNEKNKILSNKFQDLRVATNQIICEIEEDINSIESIVNQNNTTNDN